MAVVMFSVPLIAIVLWVALPSSAITVAVTAIAVLLLVGAAVTAAMRPGDLEREPGRKKMDHRS